MKLSTAHRKFLKEMEVSGASPTTLEAYGSDFHLFLTFLIREQGLTDSLRHFIAEHVRDFMHWMYDREYAPASIARRINTLSSFANWCKRWDYLKGNPCDKVKRPKRSRRVPAALTLSQGEQLLRAAQDLSRLERAVIYTMFFSGCRRAEVLGLEEKDFNAEEGTLRFKRKGGDEAVVPLAPEAAGAITDYLLARGPQSEGGHALFLQEDGRPITVKWLRGLFEQLRRRLGLPRFTPHMLRHTFITYALRLGGRLEEVAEFVGHRDLETTRGYARIAFEQLVDTVNRVRKIQASVPDTKK